MAKLIWIVLLLFFTATVSYAQKAGNISTVAKDTMDEQISYKLIQSKEKSWGYDIYLNGKLFIHQTTIPAMAGNNGFSSSITAERAARLVIEKIKKGEMPPSITVDELKKVKAI